MAGVRLECWNTLSRQELQRRVQLEIPRKDLSFPESQLLDAALERLRIWRGSSRLPRESIVKGDEEDTALQELEQPAEQPEEKKKIIKPRVRKAKVKAEPEVAAEVEHSDFHTGLSGGGTDKKAAAPTKETKVARTASKTRGKKKASVAKTKKASSTNGARRPRLDPEAKVVWVKGAENPFRENSGSYKRVETVKKNSGKTAEAISKLSGILPQTLSTMKRLGLVEIG